MDQVAGWSMKQVGHSQTRVCVHTTCHCVESSSADTSSVCQLCDNSYTAGPAGWCHQALEVAYQINPCHILRFVCVHEQPSSMSWGANINRSVCYRTDSLVNLSQLAVCRLATSKVLREAHIIVRSQQRLTLKK